MYNCVTHMYIHTVVLCEILQEYHYLLEMTSNYSSPCYGWNTLVRIKRIKYIINIQVHFVGYLYFMDLINAQTWNIFLTTYDY